MSLFSDILGPDFSLVADVAMGETANEKDDLSWYGYVRLMIWVKVVGDELGQSLLDDHGLITCVIPCGSKLSSVSPLSSSFSSSSSSPPSPPYTAYQKDVSPDKGAVCAYFPFHKLMIVSAHLHGTNKPLPESTFDEIRHNQLNRIGKGLDALVQYVEISSCSAVKKVEAASSSSSSSSSSSTLLNTLMNTNTSLLLCGDLNFRVESDFTEPEDKAKGGTDYSFVESRVSKNDSNELKEVFLNHDRLHLLLSNKEECQKVPLLMECEDVVGVEITENSSVKTQLFPPTFTYKQDATFPRAYGNKRTPSWTDRILTRNLSSLFCPPIANTHDDSIIHRVKSTRVEVSCESVREVVCSDHEAVIAVFECK
jgi:hypothetical protein